MSVSQYKKNAFCSGHDQVQEQVSAPPQSSDDEQQQYSDEVTHRYNLRSRGLASNCVSLSKVNFKDMVIIRYFRKEDLCNEYLLQSSEKLIQNKTCLKTYFFTLSSNHDSLKELQLIHRI